jgi:hypothetical protein
MSRGGLRQMAKNPGWSQWRWWNAGHSVFGANFGDLQCCELGALLRQLDYKDPEQLLVTRWIKGFRLNLHISRRLFSIGRKQKQRVFRRGPRRARMVRESSHSGQRIGREQVTALQT